MSAPTLGTCCASDGYLRHTFGFALLLRAGRQGILMGMSCGRASVRPHRSAVRKHIAPPLDEAGAQIEELLPEEDGPP